MKLQRLIRQLLLENNISADDCVVAFQQVDRDGNGEISYYEFIQFLQDVLGLQVSKRELKSLWRMIDENLSGSIDFREFADALFPFNSYEIPDSEASPTGADAPVNVAEVREVGGKDAGRHKGTTPEKESAVGPRKRSLFHQQQPQEVPLPPQASKSPQKVQNEPRGHPPQPPQQGQQTKPKADGGSGSSIEAKLSASAQLHAARLDRMDHAIERLRVEQRASRDSTDAKLQELATQIQFMASMVSEFTGTRLKNTEVHGETDIGRAKPLWTRLPSSGKTAHAMEAPIDGSPSLSGRDPRKPHGNRPLVGSGVTDMQRPRACTTDALASHESSLYA